jgi:large subunit ribosomal protein L21
MYAIVEIAGKQYRVEKETRIRVPFLPAEPGKEVHFDRVLMYRDEKGDVVIGKPVVDKINVSALVIGHGREKKIIVFKKKRRKGYQRKKGHRQDFTLLEITGIGAGRRAEKKVEPVTETRPAETGKTVPAEAKVKSVPAKKKEPKEAVLKPRMAKEVKKTKAPDVKKKAKKVVDKKKAGGKKK